MPEWAHAAAVRQALYAQRDWIGGFGRVLWRRKLPVLACVGLVLASTAAYVSALTPVYQAEALVAWDNLPDQQPGSSRAAEDPLRLSASRAMAERLVERLDLQLLPEFHPDTPSRGLRRTALTAIRPWLPPALVHWLAEGSVDTRPAERALTDEQRATRLRDAVIEAAMARMRAEVTDSSAIGLKFISEDPQIAAAGANALADLYLEQRPARRDAALPGKRESPTRKLSACAPTFAPPSRPLRRRARARMRRRAARARRAVWIGPASLHSGAANGPKSKRACARHRPHSNRAPISPRRAGPEVRTAGPAAAPRDRARAGAGRAVATRPASRTRRSSTCVRSRPRWSRTGAPSSSRCSRSCGTSGASSRRVRRSSKGRSRLAGMRIRQARRQVA